MKNSYRFEISSRISAVALLSAFIVGLDDIFGKILLVLAMCGILAMVVFGLIFLLRDRSFSEFVTSDSRDHVFLPGIVLIGTAVAYSKGHDVTLCLIFFCIVTALELSVPLIDRFRKS